MSRLPLLVFLFGTMVQRLPTLLLLASTPASADWAKGGFATLTFDTSDPGAVTYSFAYASSTAFCKTLT